MTLLHAIALHPAARNEDRAVVVAQHGSLVIAVADGAGGMPGGAEAADIVIAATLRAALGVRDERDIAQLLSAIDAECASSPRAGESTGIVMLVRDDGTIVGASAGDSEAWLIDEIGVVRLTEHQARKRHLGGGTASPTPFRGVLAPTATLVIGTDGLFGYAAREAVIEAASAGDVHSCAQALLAAALAPPVVLADDLAVVVVRRAGDQLPP